MNAATAAAAVSAVAFELPLPLPSHNKGDDDIQRLAAVSLMDGGGAVQPFLARDLPEAQQLNRHAAKYRIKGILPLPTRLMLDLDLNTHLR